MKVKARVLKTESVEIEISFPIYRYQDCGGDTYDAEYFTRIDSNFRLVTIRRASDFRSHTKQVDWEMEIEQYKSIEEYAASGSLEWITGTGDYALTEKRWTEIANEFKQAVAKELP